MNKLIFLIVAVLSMSIGSQTYGQGNRNLPDSNFSKASVDSMRKSYIDSLKVLKDSLIKIKKAAKEPVGDTKPADSFWSGNSIIIIGFFLVMIILLISFFRHIEKQEQRIGYQSIKLIGLILIFPGICILAIVGGGDKILSGQTLAVLLGTIAGYVLSRDDEPKSLDFKGTKDKQTEPPKKEESLTAKISELETKLKALEAKIPNQ